MCKETSFDEGIEKAKSDLDLMTFDECLDKYSSEISKLHNDFSIGYFLTVITNSDHGESDVQS